MTNETHLLPTPPPGYAYVLQPLEAQTGPHANALPQGTVVIPPPYAGAGETPPPAPLVSSSTVTHTDATPRMYYPSTSVSDAPVTPPSTENPFAVLLHSRKFWIAFSDAGVSVLMLLATRYLSATDVELVKQMIVILQPVVAVLIGSIAYEDKARMEAGLKT